MRKLILLAMIYAAVFTSCQNSINAQETQNVSKGNNLTFRGVPYFPIGIYNHGSEIVSDKFNTELNLLKDAGFNLIHGKFLWDSTSVKNNLDFMDRCNARGISILLEGVEEDVVKLIHLNPSVFAYIISDDANNGNHPVQDVLADDAKVKGWDSNAHFTYSAVYPRYKNANPGSSDPADYFTSCDLLGLEMYPIDSWAENSNPPDFVKSDELLQNEKDCNAFQSGNKSNRPWLAIPQTFSWASHSSGNDGRQTAKLPTPDEFRNITYVGLINGAKGVIYYEFSHPGDKNTPAFKLYKHDSLWNEVKTVNTELKELQNVYMSGNRIKLPTDNVWISASSWSFDGATYVIIANLHKTLAQNTNHTFEAKGELTNVFPNRAATLTFLNGKLSGSIAPKQVQVYKIK